ncbi:MAG: methyltransferase domain-containing protein [Planctomycetes bacterium]|nr:methyltransferase domain-containing protein [Planctomycetota bacterium]
MISLGRATRLISSAPFLLTLAFAAAAGASAAAGAPAAGAAGAAAAVAGEPSAQEILQATRIQGGLVVHVGCGDGRLTAALRANDSFLIHGLDPDAANVERARKHIQSLGLSGKVSAQRWTADRLPYADNLVNLLVSADLGRIPVQEAMRVVAPQGAAYVKSGGAWSVAVKPRPKEVDEWTHYLHDASGNAVARDSLVGPPGRVQWIADPRHTRSHEHIPSINALVSAAGRIFYVADEGPIASLREPPQWHLVARDAYNGILLWKRPFSPWFPHIVNWGQTPPQLQTRLVAAGGRVYVTLGLHAPVSVLDAATGQTVRVFERTEGTEQILWCQGVLLLAVRSVTAERTAELQKWAGLVRQEKSPLYVRETADPLVKQLRATESRGEQAIVALDAASGQVLWRKAGPDAAGLRPGSLCAIADRAIFQKAGDVVCLDLRTGRQRWSAPDAPLSVASDAGIVCADGQAVTLLSPESGKTLWTQPSTLARVRDAFVIKNAVWLGGFKPFPEKRGPEWGPYFATQHDLATGKVLKRIEPENPGHHHRCYGNKATEQYILGGRRGVEFIDLASGDVLWHSWVRGVCRYGVMPANGLLYAPPHACGCYVTAKLDGFYALAAQGPSRPQVAQAPDGRLERGPAYQGDAGAGPARADAARNPQAALRTDDWPTYRHDPQRSGASPLAVAAALRPRWQAEVGGRLTSPTVAEGKVFVASVDEHALSAMDADSGRPAWRFTAGARIDSPPTLYAGRAIFGCRDGCVYSVRASDGAPAWRLRAARDDRLIAACGQLESPSPVHGSVLVQDGAAYFAAGRSSYLDGGIDLCRVRPETGEILARTPIYSPDPATGRQPRHYGPCEMPGALADILTADDQYVYLRDNVFDKSAAVRPAGNPHLLTLTGFLDDTWPHRSYWILGARCSLSTGCSQRDKNLVFGRLLAFDASTVYGYGRASVHWSNMLQDGPYRLFALGRADGREQWARPPAIQVRAMLLADKVLLVAGPAPAPPREAAPPADARGGTAAGDSGCRGLLLALSAADGAELARCPLDSPPVFDGMAAAGGRLYISLENGRLLCMGDAAAGGR